MSRAQYGHLFGLGPFRWRVRGSATYQQARKRLPLSFLPWRLLDAGPHLAERTEDPREEPGERPWGDAPGERCPVCKQDVNE